MVSNARQGGWSILSTHTTALRDALGRGLAKGDGKQISNGCWIVTAPYDGLILIGTISGVIDLFGAYASEERRDRSGKKIKESIIGEVKELGLDFSNHFDLIIIEESHSIYKEKIDKLRECIAVGYAPRIFLLADQKQYIGKDPEWSIQYQIKETYRVPTKINEFLNSLYPPRESNFSNSLVEGEVEIFDDFQSHKESVDAAFSYARGKIEDGSLAPNEIAILDGTESTDLEQVRASWSFVKSLVDEDWESNAVFDRLARFQGFSRRLIILINVNLESLHTARGCIYLAATRATSSFAIFTTQSAGALIKRIRDAPGDSASWRKRYLGSR